MRDGGREWRGAGGHIENCEVDFPEKSKAIHCSCTTFMFAHTRTVLRSRLKVL